MTRVLRQLRYVAGAAVRDAVRRKLFVVVGILSVLFVALYGTGLFFIWREAEQAGFGPGRNGFDQEVVVASTLSGLALFAIHFLGAVVGAFLVLGAVRGDAELGTLQQVLVRPVARTTFLTARFLGAASVTVVYAAIMVLACMAITGMVTGWWPDAPVLVVLRMMGACVGLVAVALAGSVVLGSAANGVATFMVFGVALLGGLLDQLGEAISSDTTRSVGQWVLRVLPFESMYQWALEALTQDTVGIERLVVTLGPFGGARSYGIELVLGLAAFCVVLVAAGSWRLRRIDL